MNTLMTVNPWSILDEMLDVNSRVFSRLRARASGKFPPVNVFLDDDAVIVDLELPGRTAKDVELTLEPQAVVIADKPAPKMDAETGKHIETTPAWSRRLNLPFRVNAAKANAKFADGVLRIELPKADEANVRHIAIAE
ncbi:MAG: Hsp20/alpha crystallin family protein [Kiritimatiellae bacterium]|nr:Hsp20/alpha crystallin family protein [Kiritimatiellia bacterium]